MLFLGKEKPPPTQIRAVGSQKASQSSAAHGSTSQLVPLRGVAASAYAKKVPPALFLNAAASDKTLYTMRVWIKIYS